MEEVSIIQKPAIGTSAMKELKVIYDKILKISHL